MVEERIISGVLFNALVGTVLAGWIGSVVGAMLVALVIAGSSGLAKLAFDSLVQRAAPDADSVTVASEDENVLVRAAQVNSRCKGECCTF